MFDELSSRFEDAVKGLRGEAKISENNINDALKEVKRALLDADVSLSIRVFDLILIWYWIWLYKK